MADKGYVLGLLNGIQDATTKKILQQSFEHVLDNLRFGPPDHQTRCKNLQLYFEASTTASDTSEFSFAHGLGGTPKLALLALDLSQAGSRVVPLTVTRAADGKRVYLKTESGSTSAPIMLLIE